MNKQVCILKNNFYIKIPCLSVCVTMISQKDMDGWIFMNLCGVVRDVPRIKS